MGGRLDQPTDSLIHVVATRAFGNAFDSPDLLASLLDCVRHAHQYGDIEAARALLRIADLLVVRKLRILRGHCIKQRLFINERKESDAPPSLLCAIEIDHEVFGVRSS